jgi:tetratricopeptide (TPR) repeat protein
MNRQNESIELLLSRLSRSPRPEGAETELVRAYLRAGKLTDAEKLVRDRLKKDPANAQSQILLGTVLMAAGRSGEAEAAFRSAVANGEGHAALGQFYLRTGRPDEAERVARAGLERDVNNSALRLLLAEILEARGQFDGAIAEYERLITSDPTSTVVANNLASLLSERSNDPKALERAFEIAIRFHNSDVPQFLDTLGWIHYLRGEYYAALPLLKRAAAKLPDSGAVQFHLGMALKEVGEAQLAATALDRAVRLAPLPDAYYLKTATAALEQMKSVASTN